MRRVAVSLALSAALVLAACGSDSDSGTDSDGGASLSGADQELAAAFSADIAADEAGLGDVIDPDCLAAGTVTALGGADRIESEYGVTVANPDTEDVDLSTADAAAVAAAYGACGDLLEAFKSGLTADGLLTDEAAECVLQGISAADVEDFFRETLQGIEEGPESNEIFDAIFSRAEECGAG